VVGHLPDAQHRRVDLLLHLRAHIDGARGAAGRGRGAGGDEGERACERNKTGLVHRTSASTIVWHLSNIPRALVERGQGGRNYSAASSRTSSRSASWRFHISA